jgi:hypothetical protein
MRKSIKISLSTAILLLTTALAPVWSIGGAAYITNEPSLGVFPLSIPEKTTTLFVSREDFPGVIRALNDLKSDIGKVTGKQPEVSLEKPNSHEIPVMVGTLGNSKLIEGLVRSKKLDVSGIKGKWEHFLIQVVSKPLPGIAQALVIVGSDKRGTIYGIYDISEKIGVSPWYWWSDVPIAHLDRLYVKSGSYLEGPSVKYRGIFINDEAPALSNWVAEKFGQVKPSENPPVRGGVANYGHEFYSHIFELLLRIKANYLWPAMWGNAFNEDDAENPRLADEYGIVMGTSHQEPMIRSQQEWDRRYARTIGAWDYAKHPDVMESFWREGISRNKNYESIVTMGLRGANDSEMKGDLKTNIAMVEGIIQTQQKILSEELKKPLSDIPQTWCLYKEINEYYNEGMKAPDDITLLWADDNWGYIRRLPNEEERKRPGGAGVYYHFDYHGGPRSYEWINTNPLPKIWEQMSLAKQYGADRIWIVNVGHFRGYELPTEYFMNLAWNTNRWTNENLNDYTRQWATREFGPEYANDIAALLSGYGKYNARRKPESLTPRTYSLINFNEAETVVADYQKLASKAEAISAKLPKEYQDAFFEDVLFPTKIGSIVNELYVAAGKNQLYARQGRASTNDMAARTNELFKADTALMTYFNKVYANGRWNHFMDQTHLGYTSWNPPRKNSLSAIKLTNLTLPDSSILGVAVEGSENAWPGSMEIPVLPELDLYGGVNHWMEVFNRGKMPFDCHISADVPWIKVSETTSEIGLVDKRVWITLVEDKLPEGKSVGKVTVTGAGQSVTVQVSAVKPSKTERALVKGFVESDGIVSIEPEHYAKNTPTAGYQWIRVEDYGLTLSGMRATADKPNPTATVPGKNAPCLEYPVYTFSKDTVQIHLITSPVLNFMPGRDIRVAVSMDNEKPQYLIVVPASFSVQTTRTWGEGVLNQCRRLTTTLQLTAAGTHTLKVWMIDPGVVLQKIVMQKGLYKPSYLGPVESVFVP